MSTYTWSETTGSGPRPEPTTEVPTAAKAKTTVITATTVVNSIFLVFVLLISL
jgi:hypothetical protein